MALRLSLGFIFLFSAPIFVGAAENRLTVELLAHGRRQVEQMLRDRPNMAAYPTKSGFKLVKPTDPFYEWAVRKFAGEDTGSPVFWDSEEPAVASAEHSPPTTEIPAKIRISRRLRGDRLGGWKGREKGFEVLWAHAIYELNNVAGFEVFLDLHKRAIEGRIEGEAYVMGSAKNEYLAKLKSMTFYKETWLPWSNQMELQHSKQRFRAGWIVEDSFEKWSAGFTDKDRYPWVPYSKYFDEAVAWGKRYRIKK